jgi:putative DNA primase/helicase
MATYQDGALLVYADGFLYRYNYQDGAWHVLDTADVIRFIAGHDGILVKRGVDNEGSVKTKPLALSHGSCQSIYKHVCVQVSEKKFFAKRAIGAAFSNGFVKVSRNEIAIVPHSPEHRVTFAYDFPFNTSAFPERLIRFFISLQKTQQEMTLYRQFIGACILGIATTFQVGLILTGDGANGKSTFLSLVRALFPDDVVTSLTPQSLESEYHRAMLAGALCNICTEAPETRLDETSPLKAAIDGSWVTARVIQTSPFQYQPRAGWLVAANNLPGVTDKSKGWWRRWYVLPWEYEIQEHEKEPHLAEALIEERETIVSWAVASVVDLLNQRGFDEPLSSVTAKQQWKIDNDPVLEFIAACSTQGFTKSSELYAQYRAWSETQRKKALSHRKFGLRLKYHNVPCARDSRGIHYQLEHSL